ncbi:cytochrome c oxidase subunit 3 [Sphingomonas sp. KRR8]|jgi:heme/copper-type cytochrome/quinol oxidase subunit 3|uniref:cytochrome c oxidase subunit 3 n=1 Tax=Sphingomonas sp. KRR8 TaxID=2942996 RepID=UPI00201FD22D|nr:cytochrome c oxidase subunit 3 [Sphingomonas sp. KRR8]URD61846.1 cytochrome c oxidase subunit 3 [Sphingomonas sp. KRR8]
MPDAIIAKDTLPVNGPGRLSTGWWGMLCLISTEGILFAYLIFSYAYLGVQASGSWPPGGAPPLSLALPNTILLLASSVVLEVGARRFRSGRDRSTVPVLLLTALMGAVFVIVQWEEWGRKEFGFTDGAYSSIYFTLTGFHLAHVVAGILALLVLAFWGWQQRLTRGGLHLALGRMYWHFVDVVWLVVFLTIYIVPQQP